MINIKLDKIKITNTLLGGDKIINFEVNDSENKSKLSLVLTDKVDEYNNLYAPPAPPSGMHVVFRYKNEDYYKLNLENTNDLQLSLKFGADKQVKLSWDNDELKTFAESIVLEDMFGGVIFSKNLLDMNTIDISHAFTTLNLKIKLKSEEPVVEEPVVEEPVVEEPVVEEPVVEEPVVEEPVVEEPVVEEPVIEEPVVEEPVVEEPVVEEPVVEEPVIEKPVIEEPVIEEPVIEEPVVEEPVVEEPVVEEPVVEEPVVEEPVVEEPVVEEPVVEEPVVEEPVVEKPVVEEPVVEEPVVEEPVVEEPVVEEPVVEEPVVEEPVVEKPVVEEPVVEEPMSETLKISLQNKANALREAKDRIKKLSDNEVKELDGKNMELVNEIH